ncbi:MAG: META domain-containing protein [Bacteroidetes bacterium]|nr:META domain-containing protein [Bacteroidota bacterium]
MKNLFLYFFSVAAVLGCSSCQHRPVGGELKNTHWVLASAKRGNKVVAPQKGVEISLVFTEEKLTGSAPCNSYFAEFSTLGAVLTVGTVGATKRFCDEMEQENAYLALLSKAKAYSVLKDRLEVICENGHLTFAPMSKEKAAERDLREGVGKLAALFPPLEGDAMPHLYPILRVDNPGNYPYTGMLIDTSFYQFFNMEMHEIWSGTGGEVMAVGQFGDFYICRVPGRYVSSDIALFRVENGEMKHLETVAWAWCDEGWCNQQDAWLVDVDKDGRTDLVQFYTLTDDKGKIREKRTTVLRQGESGDLVADETLKPDSSKFKMAKI